MKYALLSFVVASVLLCSCSHQSKLIYMGSEDLPSTLGASAQVRGVMALTPACKGIAIKTETGETTEKEKAGHWFMMMTGVDEMSLLAPNRERLVVTGTPEAIAAKVCAIIKGKGADIL